MEIRELTKEIRDKSIEYAKPKELDSLSKNWIVFLQAGIKRIFYILEKGKPYF